MSGQNPTFRDIPKFALVNDILNVLDRARHFGGACLPDYAVHTCMSLSDPLIDRIRLATATEMALSYMRRAGLVSRHSCGFRYHYCITAAGLRAIADAQNEAMFGGATPSFPDKA